jgi:transcriptional regulator with XRE-family HTH domain
VRRNDELALALIASLRATRKAKGIRQEDVAAHLGVSRSAINMYESGQRPPTLALAMEWASFLGRRLGLITLFPVDEEAKSRA